MGDVVKAYKELEKAATSGGDGGGIFGGGSKEAQRAAKDRQLKADAKKAGVDFKEEEENDAALEEVSESMGIFKEIDEMVGRIKEQMDPDDAFDSLVSEFEAISGGTKLLHRALMNISLDNNL